MLRLGLLVMCAGTCVAAEAPWHVFHDFTSGFGVQPSGAWIGEGARSESTADGLRVLDESTGANSGRLYYYHWNVKPVEGAVVEARLKVLQASEAWGTCLNVADGVAEEDVSFFPDRVRLSYAKVEAPLPVSSQASSGDGFHTYRIVFRAPDIRVYADEKLLLDGAGKFVHPVIEPQRNRAGRRRCRRSWHPAGTEPRRAHVTSAS
jgi:hypothetical protein